MKFNKGYQAVLCTISGRAEKKDRQSGNVNYSISITTPEGGEGTLEADAEMFEMTKVDGCCLIFFTAESDRAEDAKLAIRHVIPGESLELLTAAMKIASALDNEERAALEGLMTALENANPQQSLGFVSPAFPAAASTVAKPSTGFDDMDDDIPF